MNWLINTGMSLRFESVYSKFIPRYYVRNELKLAQSVVGEKYRDYSLVQNKNKMVR